MTNSIQSARIGQVNSSTQFLNIQLKTSRLARVAFQMLLNASDEEILEAAAATENLETRRGNRY
jgi:hypothetical protein